MAVNLDAPEFKITHTMGIQNFLGSDFNTNLTEVSVYKRFWLGSWGHVDTRLQAGAQWNKVPFPFLITPPVNTSYFEHLETFNLMESLEFLNAVMHSSILHGTWRETLQPFATDKEAEVA